MWMNLKEPLQEAFGAAKWFGGFRTQSLLPAESAQRRNGFRNSAHLWKVVPDCRFRIVYDFGWPAVGDLAARKRFFQENVPSLLGRWDAGTGDLRVFPVRWLCASVWVFARSCWLWRDERDGVLVGAWCNFFSFA